MSTIAVASAYVTGVVSWGVALGGQFLWDWFEGLERGRYFLGLLLLGGVCFIWARVEQQGTRHRPVDGGFVRQVWEHGRGEREVDLRTIRHADLFRDVEQEEKRS